MSTCGQDFLQWAFFPKDYACMFEALALLRYLAQRGHWATWVFRCAAPRSPRIVGWKRDGVVFSSDEPDAVAAYAPDHGGF